MLSSSFLTKVCWLQCSCNQTWLLASDWLDTCWTCPVVENLLLSPPPFSLPTELGGINPQTKLCAWKGEFHVLQRASKQSRSLNSVLSSSVIDLSKPFIPPAPLQSLLWSFWTHQSRWRFELGSRLSSTVSSGAAPGPWLAAGFTTETRWQWVLAVCRLTFALLVVWTWLFARSSGGGWREEDICPQQWETQPCGALTGLSGWLRLVHRGSAKQTRLCPAHGVPQRHRWDHLVFS